MQSACKDNQSTYERDTISRLHYCIIVTGRLSLYNMTLTMNYVKKTEACGIIIVIIIIMSTLILCVCVCVRERERERELYMYLSNLKYLTPTKYFAVFDLQMLLR